MQVTKEPLEPCQVALTIEVETDKVVHAVDRAYREYAKYVSVPGFRKGKAPLSFVRQRIPESDVRQRTAEILVEPAYAEAIEKEEIQPYAQPKLELVQLDLTDKPFIFKAIVPLAPKVELGPYTGLTVERNQYTLSEEDINKQIERMRERAAEYPKVERAVQMDDLVIADVAANVEVRPEAAEPHPTMLEIGADNIPGFDEQVIGMSIGDEKTFTLTYPSDYPEADLQGQVADFKVTVNEIREKELPALDDALAVKVTNGNIQTLEALRESLRADMARSLVESADRTLEAKIVEEIVAHSTISYPPVLTEAEVEDDVQLLRSRLEREKITAQEYLLRVGKTSEQLTAEFEDAANKRIRIGLVLGEIAEKEELSLTDDDIETAIAAGAEEQGTTPAAMRAFLESNNSMDALRTRAQTKKVLDFLRAATIIEEKMITSDTADAAAEPDATETPAEEAEPAKKPAKRSTKAKAEVTEDAQEQAD